MALTTIESAAYDGTIVANNKASITQSRRTMVSSPSESERRTAVGNELAAEHSIVYVTQTRTM